MEEKDIPGKIKVAWSIGKGKIPNGPDFANTTGTIDLDSFGWDQISVPKGINGKETKFEKSLDKATIVLIRAIPDDNGGAEIYKNLQYKFLGEGFPEKTDFGESPLMLMGSVAKLVSKCTGITIFYDPDKVDNSTEDAGKATKPQPPKEATISILIGVRSPSSPS
jgi:hypothetical protein